MELFDIVKQRPLSELSGGPSICPFCESKDCDAGTLLTTCVGGAVNHTWQGISCRSCGKTCTRETKEEGVSNAGNVWYTTQKKDEIPRVLRGMPSCFEPYGYDCAKCGGTVQRSYLALDSDRVLTFISFTIGGQKHYRTVYKCLACGHGGETQEDHWTPVFGECWCVCHTEPILHNSACCWKCEHCGRRVQIQVSQEQHSQQCPALRQRGNSALPDRLRAGWKAELAEGYVYAPYVPELPKS